MNQTYKLLDSGNFQKLEMVGPFRMVRPAAAAVWAPSLPASEWERPDATFVRFSDGNGEWKVQNAKMKQDWDISVEGITFRMRLTSFGHLGIFPEQRANWVTMRDLIRKRKTEVSVLNLFAYTGGSTMFCADGGAKVVHLDASKTSVTWGRENAELSGLKEKPIRWIVDDVQEFVEREVRRGSRYQGFILDPPTYGRGSKNQMWKIEEHLVPLLRNLRRLAADDLLFVLLSSHSPGYTPIALENLLRSSFGGFEATGFDSREMIINQERGDFALPSGAYSMLIRG